MKRPELSLFVLRSSFSFFELHGSHAAELMENGGEIVAVGKTAQTRNLGYGKRRMEFEIDFRFFDSSLRQKPAESASRFAADQRTEIIRIHFQQVGEVGKGDVFQIMAVDEVPAVFDVKFIVVLLAAHAAGGGKKFQLYFQEICDKYPVMKKKYDVIREAMLENGFDLSKLEL